MENIGRQEAIARGLTRYFTGKPCKAGHVAPRKVSNRGCVECCRDEHHRNYGRVSAAQKACSAKNAEKIRDYQRQYQSDNRDRIGAQKKEYREREDNKRKAIAYGATYRVDNRERLLQQKREYYDLNREPLNAKRAQWKRDNPGLVSADNRARKLKQISATPWWAELDEIEELYVFGSDHGYQVDHIIPIRNKMVCGLHVIANLQLLTFKANRYKSNTFNAPDHEWSVLENRGYPDFFEWLVARDKRI